MVARVVSIALLVALAATALTVQVVKAAPASPSLTNIEDVNAYRDLLEDGDMLVLVEYNLAYATLPADGAGVNFIVQLKDSAGTVIATNTPYPYNDLGYGKGVTSLYLDAAGVTAASLGSWPFAGLTVRLQGNPTVFSTIPSDDWSLVSGHYSTGSGNATNDSQLGVEVISTASALQQAWQVTLLTESANLLNATDGTPYFTLAVPNIRNMASSIYSVSTTTPTFEEPVAATGTLEQTAGSRFDNTSFIDGAFNSLADDFGLPRGFIKGMVMLGLMIGLIALMTGWFGPGAALVGFGIGVVAVIPIAMWGDFVAWAFGALALALVVTAGILKTAREQVG